MSETTLCSKCQQAIPKNSVCSTCVEVFAEPVAGLTLQQWRVLNPKGKLNDYYREHGTGTTTSQTTSIYMEAVSEAKPILIPTSPEAYTTNYTINNKTVIVQSTKSVFVALLLTVFFGALGLFYSSGKGGLIMLVLSVVAIFAFTSSIFSISAFGSSFGAIGFVGGLIWLALIQWPVSILWAVMATVKHNRNVKQMAAAL